MDTFAKAMALERPAGEPVDVPYEGTTIPAWFLRTPLAPDEVRPTILVGGGWDSTMVENHLGMGVAALRRGYHVLLHDGPGQGKLLIDEGLILRHDWEKVVTPGRRRGDRPGPRRRRPASCTGRGASAATWRHASRRSSIGSPPIVADPGQMDVGGKIVAGMKMMGLTDAQEAELPALDPDFAAGALQVFKSSRALDWSICKRGFWTNGGADLQAFVTEIMRWKLDAATVAQITCPTLVTSADDDRASTDTQQLFDALVVPEGAHPLHRRGGREHALRDAEPVSGQPEDPRLARRRTPGEGPRDLRTAAGASSNVVRFEVGRAVPCRRGTPSARRSCRRRRARCG